MQFFKAKCVKSFNSWKDVIEQKCKKLQIQLGCTLYNGRANVCTKAKIAKKTYACCTIGVTMGNQKQKGQSDGSDSDWTLCRTNLLLDICSFYPGFSLEVVFQFLNDKISIFSWFGVHNPLKSFPKPHRPN